MTKHASPRANLSRVAALLLTLWASPAIAADDEFSFARKPGRVEVRFNGSPIAEYFFRDAKITRPYFAHVKTIDGIQVTRNHPPQPGDAQDHPDYHPGIFLAFGDLAGSDNWRLKAKVEHLKFLQPPRGGKSGAFAVQNRYLSSEGRELCREDCSFRFLRHSAGVLLIWESRFRGERAFYFGDQEEMGLGVRVATELSVKRQGRILDADGRRNEKQVWGKPSRWCDYGGQRKGRQVGLTVMSDPGNFRPSWHHARDYGFLAANPFGRKAFTGGEASRREVRKGETFPLNYGVLIRQGASDADAIESAYKLFVAKLAPAK